MGWTMRVAAVVIAACLLVSVAPAASAGGLEARNKAVAADYLKALGTGDAARIASFWADDIQWTIPQDPSLSRLAGVYDKAGLLKLLGGFKTMMPHGAVFTPIAMTAEGERVAVEAVSEARTPVGAFRNQYHFLLVFRDGKIAAGKEYADSLFMNDFRARVARASPAAAPGAR